MKKIIILVAAAAVVVIAIVAMRGRGSDNTGISYDVAAAEISPLWVKVSATGLVQPFVEVEVKSKASGVVTELPLDAGDAVTRGQVIARLDPVEVLNQLESEEAALAVAHQNVRVQEEEVHRAEQLAKHGLVSERDLEAARLDLERARADEVARRISVTDVQKKLDDTVLRSPIDGIVLEKLVEVGQVISSGVSNVSGGTTLAIVADLRKVFVTADVDETDIGRVQTGLRVEVVPDAYPHKTFRGVVERINPKSKVVQNVTTFEVMTVVENEGDLLKAGMNASVDIVIAGRDDALVVPRKAVQQPAEAAAIAGMMGIPFEMDDMDGRKRFVFVLAGGDLTMRPVETGLFDWNQYEITGGLNEGEEVAVFQASRALQQSREFAERIRGRSMPGFRKSSD
jgi:HlyD family secretion protein